MKTKRRPLPTEAQTRVLRRIAQAGGILMLTHDAEGDRYSDALGATVPGPMAKTMIRNGWVTAERGSMFDLAPQVWRTR